nr:hypothetical protein Iba_chr14fCG6660 [Ipomoea batatas]
MRKPHSWQHGESLCDYTLRGDTEIIVGAPDLGGKSKLWVKATGKWKNTRWAFWEIESSKKLMKTWQPADESWWKQWTPGMLEKLSHANSPRPCMPHAKQYGEMAASPPRPPRFAWSTNDIELPRVPPVVPPPNLPK